MITWEMVKRCREIKVTEEKKLASRISFAYTHKNQPTTSDPPYRGYFKVPFGNAIADIFMVDTGFPLYKNGHGLELSIQSDEDFQKISQWVAAQGTRIFLRDCLDMSIALDLNLTKDEGLNFYTQIGLLELKAKKKMDEQAVSDLVDHFCSAIQNIVGYQDSELIAAVPPNPGKSHDLPSILAARIAERLELEDITPDFRFESAKRSVKTLTVDQKWAAWEKAGLKLDRKLENMPSIILIDDKYQSGITIQFVASRLKAAGAGKIFGLCAVKTLRDTDNQ